MNRLANRPYGTILRTEVSPDDSPGRGVYQACTLSAYPSILAEFVPGVSGTLVEARNAKLADRARDTVWRIRDRPQAAPHQRIGQSQHRAGRSRYDWRRPHEPAPSRLRTYLRAIPRTLPRKRTARHTCRGGASFEEPVWPYGPISFPTAALSASISTSLTSSLISDGWCAWERSKPETRKSIYSMGSSTTVNISLRSSGGDAADIVIDDASHADESILATFESFRERLARKFVYFVEDNEDVHSELIRRYPQYRVDSLGEMTVVTDLD